MDSRKIVSLTERRRAQAQAADPDYGRRRAERARVVLPAHIFVNDERRPVDLLNLSATGAMIAGAEGLGIGQDVVLKCTTLEIMGVVVWAGNGRCGLQFDQSVPELEVKRHWFEGIRAAGSGVTPGLRAAAEAWVARNSR